MAGRIISGTADYYFHDLACDLHLPGVQMEDITTPGASGVQVRFAGIGADTYTGRGTTVVVAGNSVKNWMRLYSQLRGAVATVYDRSGFSYQNMLIWDVRQRDTQQVITSVPAGAVALLYTTWQFQSISTVAGYA